eukprot:scaffold7349_cov129-Skeletonema_dohrnii-CCMP3373.AAC.13
MTTLATASSELLSILSKDSAACTRALARWKSEILPTASSTDEILQLFNCSQNKDSLLSALLAIINDELAFITTEGHRESSVEILRGLLQRAFGQQKVCDEANSQEDHIGSLQSLFQQCSRLFERRMSRQDGSTGGFHGSSMTSLEQSEHIRLSLVALLAELGSYLITRSVPVESIEQAASCICQMLAKYIFNDPFPDILLASCTLVQTLAKLCPAAVELHATDLLLQLAGKDVKHCLFRNRRSKIRSEAVVTSSAIVHCCQDSDSSNLSNLQEALQSILLPGWEELVNMDTSVSVRVAALNAVGMTAKQFDWTYSLAPDELTSFVESKALSLFVLGASDENSQVQESAIQQMINALSCGSHNGQGRNVPWNAITRYFHPVIEVILASCSLSWSACKDRVRSLEALQVFLSFAITILDSNVVTDQSSSTLLPRMQPIVECLRKNIVCEEKDVLQVRNTCIALSLNEPLHLSLTFKPFSNTHQAALTACSILGGSDTCSTLVLDMLTASSEDKIELSKDAIAMISSPREAASTMLLLSRMVKGMICNEEAAVILRRVDPTLSLSTPNWIYTSPSSMATITMLLSHTSVTNYVAANPSLAWALLDTVSEVVKCCKHHLSIGEDCHDGSWTLKEESVLEILIGIVHLLGCPEAYGLSSQANEVLHEFSSCFLCDADSDDTKRSLLDAHFRKLVLKITAAVESTFPWKESDAAFSAMTALLRTVEGSTVSSNFEVVAPFFMHHMSSAEIAKEGEPEEYSLRITLMSVLQCILSDKTFHSLEDASGPKISPAGIILSLVLPNLVWRAGGLASALRKLSVATVFSVLCHMKGTAEASALHSDILAQLIPVLHSCLEDTEPSTRELACVCLSLVLEQSSSEMIQAIWETNARIVDTLQHSLLSLLDDNHSPTRLAACRALKSFLTLRSPSEKVVSSLIVHLDDDEQEVKEQVHLVLETVLLEEKARDRGAKVLATANRCLKGALHTHRDGSYCSSLLGLLEG